MIVWTDNMVNRMIDLTQRGFMVREIADRLKVSIKSVENKRTRMRIAGDPRLPIRGPDQSSVGSAGKVSRPLTPPPPPIAPRDPCFRCGVRGDVGCVHQPAAIAA